MKEKNIQTEILISCSAGNSRLFRNQVGMYELADGRWLASGIGDKGGSDLIGWTKTVITPDMVGQSVAVFTALEIKQPGKKPKPEQVNFIAQVKLAGGIAGVATSTEEAKQLLCPPIQSISNSSPHRA